jgi:long-chain acyl-CoA synthetase
MKASELLAGDFGTLSDLIRAHAAENPTKPAIVCGGERLTYAELDELLDRFAAAAQADGLGRGAVAAVCGATSLNYAIAFLGALRAGAAVAPMPVSASPSALTGMLVDSGASHLFLDVEANERFRGHAGIKRIALDGIASDLSLSDWLAAPGAKPADPGIQPEDPFNIIYSSGTTGTPKGILQPARMRWAHIRRGYYDADSITIISTPLYSNTTLVSFLPALGNGGAVVLMPKFDVEGFLRLSERHQVTHAMLVPVQYQRIMAFPDFGSYNLSSYRLKLCTSAPFAASLKADILERWPGQLIEIYGMTEGGGTCALAAHDHPDKLHTVGRPLPGHDIRLIDEQGREVPAGALGEVVGRSSSMMTGYYGRPEATSAAEWWSPDGERYIRTGDIGRFDEDGFLILMDRKKDMIISGGFNIYPSDLERELLQEDAVQEAAVVGVPSAQWGETPVAFVVPRPHAHPDPAELMAAVNARLGRMQRLFDVRLVESLPRNQIGKVLKRQLRDDYAVEA